MGDGIRLDPEPRRVGQARRYCTSVLRGWGADADLVATCKAVWFELDWPPALAPMMRP